MGKAPRGGNVKTRLSPVLPLDATLEFYSCLLDDTVRLARKLRGVHVGLVCPRGDVPFLEATFDSGVQVVEQEGEGLARGLVSAFRVFLAAGFRRVIAFDSDSPHVPEGALETAFSLLKDADVVAGPTEDGGYYLVGAKAIHPELFDASRLGTQSALAALISAANKLSLSVALTEECYDVDQPEDLIRLAADLRRDPGRAPRTAALLATWPEIVSGSSEEDLSQ